MEDKGKEVVIRSVVNVVKCTFFVTSHLDKDQVRVSEVGPQEFRVKCGRMLTDQEVKGAIVKYMLAKANKDKRLHD